MNNIINEKKACCGPGYASPTEAIKHQVKNFYIQ
jgi:hypothetical protein